MCRGCPGSPIGKIRRGDRIRSGNVDDPDGLECAGTQSIAEGVSDRPCPRCGTAAFYERNGIPVDQNRDLTARQGISAVMVKGNLVTGTGDDRTDCRKFLGGGLGREGNTDDRYGKHDNGYEQD